MRYLITGASGFIGSKLVKTLLSRGHSVNYLGSKRGTSLDSRAAFHGWNPGEKAPLNSVPTVDAIVHLAGARERLEAMSGAVRLRVEQRYDAVRCTREYQRLYRNVMRKRRPHRPRPLPYGSRLDKPWVPNSLVQFVRRHLAGSR